MATSTKNRSMKKSLKSNKRRNVINKRKTRKNMRNLIGGDSTEDFSEKDKEQFSRQTDLTGDGGLTQVGLDKELYKFAHVTNKNNNEKYKNGILIFKDRLKENLNLVKLLNPNVLNKVKYLDLSSNENLFNSTNNNIEHLCNFLEKSTKVTKLIIMNCFNYELTINDFIRFFNAIGNNKSLEYLNIKTNAFFMIEDLKHFYYMYINLVKNTIIKTICYNEYYNKNTGTKTKTYENNKTLIINDLFYKMIKISIEKEEYSLKLSEDDLELFKKILVMLNNEGEFTEKGSTLSNNEKKQIIKDYIPTCISIIESIIKTTNPTNNTDNGIPTQAVDSETF